MSFDIPYQMRQLASSLPFPYYKRQTTCLQTFGIPEISQTFYPFYKKRKIDPKKELKFWTTLIIVLLKEQSTVYVHEKLLRPSQ
jgi:hypothetical protein